jgi:nucleoside-diphosphate-sugar epimerase
VKKYYHHAVGNITSVNEKSDYSIYSKDVLYMISTVHNYNIYTDVHLDVDTNLTLLLTVLENWKRYQEKTGEKGVFNFVSSWSVYGNQEKLPVAEDAVCNPNGFYIITKRCAEQLLICYCETFGLKYRILRFANIIGPGDAKVSAQKNVLQYSINKLAKDENVELFGNGFFLRDFMHVEDCVEAVEKVLTQGKENEIYNIGNGSTWYYGTILLYAKKELGSKGSIIYKEPTEFQKKVPVASFYMNVSKLRQLGFRPKYLGTTLYDSILLNIGKSGIPAFHAGSIKRES